MNLKKLFLLIGVLLFIIGVFLGFNFYNKLYKPNTSIEGSIYIPTNSNYSDVENLLRPFLNRVNTFAFTATLKNYKNAVKPGKYHISKEMNNNQLINLLKSGRQTTVKLSFNNQDTFEKLAGRIAEQIEADSLTLLNAFKDPSFLAEAGFTEETSLGMYIPNTYEFYWNTSAELFRKKMLREYQNFWNKDRLEKAKRLNLSQTQVITLASIVQKETASVRERPRVAGLYLNRLNDKWPLQADPTIIFALKKQAGNDELVIKRVLKKDLDIDSPYNTYKNLDLPPGLISMPDISSIDAVLNSEKHDFYYMCASISNIGTHEFAKTLSQHNRNAAIYQKWLNQQGVNR